ncbi:MAG: NADH-quinone oxidoreductase subunit N [Bacteroidia bacterium]|nr:NADH-quinone oxidoreductase subunit N [Bacteroidia bacterium]MCX7764618.1 NADH-quinone oxidoreductase subunit N [Bacteroidia bacterium]MDW8057422.1 NADH-quinone oxidoreductase subunit N [Bacteroidia bacterium]
MQGYLGILPVGWLALGGVSGLLLGTFRKARRLLYGWSLAFALGGVALGAYLSWKVPMPSSTFFGMAWGGGLYSFVSAGIGFISAIGLSFLHYHLRQHGGDRGWEALPLSLLMAAALTALSASNHLILSVVALETVSLGAYVLAALSWEDRFAPEAAVKYFLLSTLGFVLLLFGLSYLYGISGTLYLHHLRILKWEAWQGSGLYILALSFIGMGLFVKLSVFPFHWWAPDVYGGATPGATGMLVAFGKLNATFLAVQILHVVKIPAAWLMGGAVLGAISALYGNLSALGQPTLQRALAYSSVAHGGYLLLGLVSGAEGRLQAQAYAMVYGIMSSLAFGLLALAAEPLEYKALRGLGYQKPTYAIALAVALASLSGLPPFAGFFAKYAVFASAFRAGHVGATIAAIVAAVIGYFYYWRPIAWMFQPGEGHLPVRTALATGTIVLLILGVIPAIVWGWMDYLYGLAGYFQTQP